MFGFERGGAALCALVGFALADAAPAHFEGVLGLKSRLQAQAASRHTLGLLRRHHQHLHEVDGISSSLPSSHSLSETRNTGY